jgi:Protein of unknown function (DUF2693).
MTVEEIRGSIATLCEDQEIFNAYKYLDGNLDWPINETFNLLVLLDELKKRMHEDVTHFTFKKKDGTIRQAYGTRVSEVIVRHEGAMLPSEEKKPRPSTGTFPYYDIERQAWRCFKLDGLMDIDRGYTI